MTKTKKLGEVFDIRKGKKAAATSDTYVPGSQPYIQIDEVRGVAPTKFAIDCNSVEVTADDLCIVWDGANAGTVGYGVAGAIGSTVSRLRLKEPDRWDPRFLGRLLDGLFPKLNQEAQRRGATIPHVDKDKLKEIDFPLLDPTEQRRIATILDKADAIRRKREQALILADNFLRSVFLEMFGDLNENPHRWQSQPVAMVLATDPQNGLYRHSSDYGSGTQILRIDGFYDGYLVGGKSFKRLRIDQATKDKYLLQENDIVINRVNSPQFLGKCALIFGLTEDTVFESNMMRFSADATKVNPRFLVDQFRSQYMKRQIATSAKPAVNQSSINQTDVKSFVVRLPPIELQNLYAEIVSAKDRADARLRDAVGAAKYLFAALSQRAFAGDL